MASRSTYPTRYDPWMFGLSNGICSQVKGPLPWVLHACPCYLGWFVSEFTETLHHQTYGWEDKYRPRKPRFFNRVHTGFEWNKYNQTHYDKENPPPKMVQGYKFNVCAMRCIFLIVFSSIQ